MSIGTKQRSIREAKRRRAQGQSEEQVVKFLTRVGFDDRQAADVIATVDRDLDAVRPAFKRKRAMKLAFAVFMVLFGLALCVLGAVVARPQSVVIGLVNIGIGAMNSYKAWNESLADFQAK